MGDVFISGGSKSSRRDTGSIPDFYIHPQSSGGEPGKPQRQQRPPHGEPPAQPREGKKKSGGHKHLKRFLAAALVIALLISASGFYIYTFARETVYTPDESPSDDSGLISSPSVTNILLIGVDRRKGETVSRSDSMILVSVDTLSRRIKLTSFLRDLWVEIPECGYAKMNAACSYGGPELVMQTIEANFGIKVNSYMLVDFVMFSQLVDAIGGVDVEVTEDESRLLERNHGIRVDSGKNVHLDGTEALWFCRIRKLDSDFERTSRQRKTISAIIEKSKGVGIFKLLAAAKEIMPNIETNIPPARLSALAMRGAVWLLYGIESQHIPADDTWDDAMRGGQEVLAADMDANREIVKTFIYGK